MRDTHFSLHPLWTFALAAAVVGGLSSCDNNATAPAPTADTSSSVVPAARTPNTAGSESAANTGAATASGGGMLRLDAENAFAGVAEMANVKLNRTRNGLELTASTVDPQLLLPAIDATAAKMWSIHIRITSPGATTLQMFYTTKRKPDFEETHSVRKPLQKGDNDIEVQFGDPDLGSRVRLDPGELPGNYIVQLIELRPVNSGSGASAASPSP